jgi:hypothetical protein
LASTFPSYRPPVHRTGGKSNDPFLSTKGSCRDRKKLTPTRLSPRERQLLVILQLLPLPGCQRTRLVEWVRQKRSHRSTSHFTHRVSGTGTRHFIVNHFVQMTYNDYPSGFGCNCQQPETNFSQLFHHRVEMRGLEPLTLALQTRCSPS